jgi:hypothetical protein
MSGKGGLGRGQLILEFGGIWRGLVVDQGLRVVGGCMAGRRMREGWMVG